MKKIDKPIYVNLGKQLKEARLRKGYSLAEVAEMVGKSKASIKRYEDATMRVDTETLEKMCNVLGLQIMDMSTYYNDELIDDKLSLYQKMEEFLPYDKELQESNEYFEKFAEKVMDKFIHLDINLQKSILMTLGFDDDEIAEVMKFLH